MRQGEHADIAKEYDVSQFVMDGHKCFSVIGQGLSVHGWEIRPTPLLLHVLTVSSIRTEVL